MFVEPSPGSGPAVKRVTVKRITDAAHFVVDGHEEIAITRVLLEHLNLPANGDAAGPPSAASPAAGTPTPRTSSARGAYPADGREETHPCGPPGS